MKFTLVSTDYFLKQIALLDSRSKNLINSKLDLILINPYRFKRIHSKKFGKVFRVRLNLQGKETRLIYVVKEPDIIVVCLLERKHDYNDLEKRLETI